MPSKLVSTGVQFPDGSTQTTAAVAGVSVSNATTTVMSNQGNFGGGDHASFGSSFTYVNFSGQIASTPYANANTRRFHTPYGTKSAHGMAVNASVSYGVNYQRYQDIPPYPANHNQYSSGKWGFGHNSGPYGERPGKGAWRINYKYI